MHNAHGGWYGPEHRVSDVAGDYAPYAAGDRPYVREAWHVRGQYSDVVEIGYRASERRGHTEYVNQIPVARAVPGKGKWPEFPKYGPSIHMPRWASRLTLLVDDVRVQRLQDIDGSDAEAEGITPWPFGEWFDAGFVQVPAAGVPPITRYAHLWNSLHTKEGERWEDNPWIVAVTFRVINANIDEIPNA